MAEKRRVVIVDDSPSMRAMLARLLLSDGRFDVVGEAGDPFEARSVIKATRPHVVTLDVEMPRMDGLSFLEKIISLRPLPVVMLSSGTGPGSDLAVEALARGAIDCLGKDGFGGRDTAGEVADRIFEASLARVEPRASRPAAPDHTRFRWNGRIVLIGSSTGGVEALERVLGAMPPNAPPIVVVQHMPAPFMESLARRLSGLIAPRVVLARPGLELAQGMVVFAPGGPCHLELQIGAGVGTLPQCRLTEGDLVSGHRPSVDRLFHSAIGLAPQLLAILLTGMGRDGAAGMLELRAGGARSLAQSKESSTVWGMPRVAWETGAAEALVPLDRVGDEILAICGKQPVAIG
ncbi:chemotaxis-specific protein-glutamate methyltransferase CheB [Vannielia litorea]|uniref:Protein-glutamate methylesterase/protein-glutamine glutaminase n=1 Tax=Vannielia litorea TaxID=1217970 RepID=A0A1N6F2N6_9RHOB|nr:chemotaxis-specific protein-glutamate methyltransferase CheB [Vannielia litorea]SIN89525.1 two-component system, chemotaxis family, response regulator CheB [Vannielia litorea]